MKNLFFLLLPLIAATACGQTARESNNTKQINIPGTHLFIAPPADFSVAPNFSGLQRDAATQIQITDLEGGSFYTNAATFSKQKFESKGIKVLDYQETTINNFPAKVAYLQSSPNSKGYIAVFGDSTFSAMAIARFPSSDNAIDKQIKQALLSIKYDKKLKLDPLASAPFRLDESKSKFKFAKSGGGLFIYSVGGINKESFGNEPMLMVTTVPVEHAMTPTSIATEMMAGVEKYGLSNKQVNSTSTQSVNGYQAYEMEGTGDMKGQKCAFEQLVVVQGDKAIVFQGMAYNDFVTNIQSFKNLVHTVQFK